MDKNLPRDMIFQHLFPPIFTSPPYLRTPLPGSVGLWYLSPALLSSRFTIPWCQKRCSLPHKQGCRALSSQLKALICHQGCSPSLVCEREVPRMLWLYYIPLPKQTVTLLSVIQTGLCPDDLYPEISLFCIWDLILSPWVRKKYSNDCSNTI